MTDPGPATLPSAGDTGNILLCGGGVAGAGRDRMPGLGHVDLTGSVGELGTAEAGAHCAASCSVGTTEGVPVALASEGCAACSLTAVGTGLSVPTGPGCERAVPARASHPGAGPSSVGSRI